MSDGECQSSSSERQLRELCVCGITSSVTVDVHKLHPWAVSFTVATMGRQGPACVLSPIGAPGVGEVPCGFRRYLPSIPGYEVLKYYRVCGTKREGHFT